ncbi:MAG TPA: TatD family hydrolase [Bacteroidia bacterium]|nr:TatD family hydrolase [Bacteroidia bacterium]
MIPFINIHTHQFEIKDEEITIANLFSSSYEKLPNEELFSVGIHPWYINENRIEEQFIAVQNLSNSINCLAIGECGLDKLRGPDLNLQHAVFIRQISLAIELNKPIVVHCVQSFDILLAIIKRYHKKAVFIVHGFNQNIQIAEHLIQLGAYLSFGKVLLNARNEKLKIIFRQTPLDKIFLENDDSSIPIQEIYEAAAGIKNCNLNVMKEVIFANYKKVFLHE